MPEDTRPDVGTAVDGRILRRGQPELRGGLPAGGAIQAKGQPECQHVQDHLEPDQSLPHVAAEKVQRLYGN